VVNRKREREKERETERDVRVYPEVTKSLKPIARNWLGRIVFQL